MPEEDHRFHLTVGSRFENIEMVQTVLNDTLLRLGFEDDARHWIDLAVREAVANAIKHGNREDPGKRVQVVLAVEGEDLVIQVEDEGEGFEPVDLSDPLSPDNLLNPNGRGIFYMKSFMDEIDFAARPAGGTTVTMRKRISGPVGDAASDQ